MFIIENRKREKKYKEENKKFINFFVYNSFGWLYFIFILRYRKCYCIFLRFFLRRWFSW